MEFIPPSVDVYIYIYIYIYMYIYIYIYMYISSPLALIADKTNEISMGTSYFPFDLHDINIF